jgi:small subunit ribosomal protein S17
MADEENESEETAEEAPEAAEEAPAEEAAPEAAEEAPAEEAAPEAAEEAPAEEAAPEAEDAPAEEPEAADAPAADGGDDGEAEAPLTPKQLRKLERSKHTGEAKPQRSASERAAERAERRRTAAANRRRYRQRSRERRGESGQGTPPAERAPGTRKVRQGMVVSAKADKTITVRIDVVRRHPQYEKVVRRSATLRAHDESNEAQEGDKVRVVETRPLSRTKRWRLVEVVEKAR